MPALRAKRFTSALVPLVLTYVRSKGKDPKALEKKYLHVRSDEGHASPEVSLDELGGILADAAKLLGDPLFGFHCALGRLHPTPERKLVPNHFPIMTIDHCRQMRPAVLGRTKYASRPWPSVHCFYSSN